MSLKKYRQNLSTLGLIGLVPGLPAMASDHTGPAIEPAMVPPTTEPAVLIDEFRLDHVYTLAQHRSHSSHRSHRSHQSHRSSSGGRGGSYSAPQTATPSRNYNSTPNSSVLPSSPALALVIDRNNFEEHIDIVRRVQASLYIQGLYTGELDGIYGPETGAAISKFQSNRGRSVTGRITSGLLDALDINDDAVFDDQTYLKTLPGNSATFKRIVQEVQVILYLYGYYNGNIDGVIGGQTRSALQLYQIDYGLTVTGTLTTETLDALHVVAR